MTVDPVCGISIHEVTAAAKLDYLNRTYYFCCQLCRARFELDPVRYTSASRRALLR